MKNIYLIGGTGFLIRIYPIRFQVTGKSPLHCLTGESLLNRKESCMAGRKIKIRPGEMEVWMEVTEEEYQSYYRPWW